MSIAAIAADLGISERAVRFILRGAIAKLRAHPQIGARFRTAVKERRAGHSMRVRETVPGPRETDAAQYSRRLTEENFGEVMP